MDLILSNNTRIFIDLSLRSKPVGYKWVFRGKNNTNENIQTFKARLVAKTFQTKGNRLY